MRYNFFVDEQIKDTYFTYIKHVNKVAFMAV